MASAVGVEVARLRGEQGLSQDGLCQRCSALGYPLKRTSLAAFELGNRQTLAVHEVIVLATALGVAPLELLFPANHFTSYLPGVELPCFEAAERFTGRPAQEVTWAETLARILTDTEGRKLLDVVNAIRARHRG